MTDFAEFIHKYIPEHLGIETENYAGDLDIFSELGADELDMVEIMMAIEEEFGIELPDLDYGTGDDFVKAAQEA